VENAPLRRKSLTSSLKERLRYLVPRTLAAHRILGGPLRGSAIVTSWHDYPRAILGRAEPDLLAYFSNNVGSNETWLDIGANCGYTAIAISKLVGRAGRVYAFEPMLSTVGSLARTRFLNNLSQLTVIPMALGHCEDLATESLYSSNGMVDSTLDDNTAFRETFMVSSFDWLWPRISGPDSHIDGVKIDVQGMEIQVLKGMTNTLHRFRPKLLVEIHKGVSRSNLLDVIASIGYLPCGYPVEPLPGESEPVYADDRTYLFSSAPTDPVKASMVNSSDLVS
jgi:FkbM family methyltransferase